MELSRRIRYLELNSHATPVDLERLAHSTPLNLSDSRDYRLPLRFAGLLHGEIGADVCASTGAYSASDVAGLLLAGASAVQMVSGLLRSGPAVVGRILSDLDEWMASKGLGSIEELRGTHSRASSADPRAYTRAQYVRQVMVTSA